MPRVITAVVVSLLALALSGCGDEIGDACQISSDCSQAGDRICDSSSQSPEGYCTIPGCDVGTCPEGSVCIRFFGGVTNTTAPCDPRTEDRTTDDCPPDDLCTLAGTCVPRTAETRFCMKTCDDGGDCRDKYECRDEALMREHGGEPVPEPGEALGDDLQAFCAAAP